MSKQVLKTIADPSHVPAFNNPTRYEKLYEMLMDAVPSSVLLLNREIRIVSANRYFLEKSQRSLSGTIGHRLKEVFPEIILKQMNMVAQIRQVLDQNRPTEGQRMTYRTPGLLTRTYHYTLLPFSWKSGVENVMLLMVDITDQVSLSEEVHRVQRHLASVVECASDIVLSMDTQAKILTWNPAAEKVSGHTFAEVKGCLFYDYCENTRREELKNLFISLSKASKTVIVEGNLITRDDAPVQVSWVFSPMRDDYNHTVGVVAVGRDLTEHRKLEIQLLQVQKLTALGVMAGGIAHEIRNPLAIASSCASFLLEDDIDPVFRSECATKAYASIHRASTIIENLLRFARAPINTEMTKINLTELVQETLNLIMSQAVLLKVHIKSDLPREPMPMIGNAGLLQQMLMNLSLNAFNAMPTGGTFTVTLKRIEQEMRISISDTGKGIPATQIDRVFEPFFTTSPVGKGTGLGLSICYTIVKQHFGSIEVSSVFGEGSTFIVRLPSNVQLPQREMKC